MSRRSSLFSQASPPRAASGRRAGFFLFLVIASLLALAIAQHGAGAPAQAMPAQEPRGASHGVAEEPPALPLAEPPPMVSVLPGWWVASGKPALAPPTFTTTPTLWAGTNDAGVWLYEDGAWEQESNGLGDGAVRHIQMDPFDEDVILAVTEDGVYRTTDGGDDWSQVTMPYTQAGWNRVHWDRSNPGIVFAGGPIVYVEESQETVAARSTDGGVTWVGIVLPYGSSAIWVSDIWGNGPHWYMMGASINTWWTEYYWRSFDGGATWERKEIDIGSNYWATYKYVTGHDEDPGRIYVIGHHTAWAMSVLRSTNAGDDWSLGAAETWVTEMLYDYTHPGALWTPRHYNLRRSQDNGDTFTTVLDTDDLEEGFWDQCTPQDECSIEAVAVDGYTGRAYTGGENRAVAYSDDGGDNWSDISITNTTGTSPTTDVATIDAPRPNPFLWDQSLAPIECPFGSSTAINNWVDGAINTRMGNYHYGQQDISIPTIGGSLYFERSYNANATAIYTGSLNYGWTHNYDVQLIFSDTVGGAPGIVTVQGCRGSRFRFNDNEDGTHTPFPGVWATLTRTLTAPYTYTLTGVDQSVYLFDDVGQLTEMRNPQGQAITLIYDGTQLARVEDPSGERFLAFAYDGQGRLAEVRDPISRTVTYGYDGAGNLTVVTDTRGLAWTYTYSDTHLLYEVRDPAGDVVERTEYDDGGRVVRRWDGTLGEPLQIGYGISGTTTITDGNGHATTDRYDGQGTLIWQGNPYGSSERSYDFYFNWNSTTDANGNTTGYVFNHMGRPQVITDALDGVTQMAYDDRDHLTELTDAGGHTTRYEYDGNPLVATTDALSGTLVNTYDDRGLLIQTVNHGVTTTYGYDEFGQRVAMTDALSHVTTYGYDAVGRLVTTTVGVGEYGGVGGERVTVNEYDAGDNLVRVTRNYTTAGGQNYLNAYNLVTEYGYDEVGHRVATTGTLSHVTRSWYDGAGRLISATTNYSPTVGQNYQNQWNLTTWYGYDAVGNQVLVTDTLGHATYTEYDELGRVERAWRNYRPGYPQNYQDQYNLAAEYAYDAVGNQTLVTDTLGAVTRSWYDELNRLISSTINYSPTVGQNYRNQWNLTTRYGYDAVGNQTQITNPQSQITKYEYDALNRPVTVTANYVDGVFDPAHPDEDLVRVTAYDAAGRVSRMQDAGGRITVYEYDALGRQVAVIQNYQDGIYEPAEPDRDLRSETVYDALGQVEARVQVADTRITTTYQYDVLGRLVTTTNGLSGTTTTHYDALGRRIETVDAEGNSTYYGYDAAGRLVTTTNALSGTITTTYDALGQRVATTDPLGHTSVYTYDVAGRLVAQADPLGNTTQYGYDPLGRRTVVTDADGVAVYSTYDSLGRLSRTQDAGGNATRYGYDALGNRTVMTDANGIATRYEHDGVGRLVAVTENYSTTGPIDHQTNVRTEYGYDASGNLVRVTDGLTHTTVYTYDLAGRRVAEADPLGNVTEYQYDGHGRRVGEIYPDEGSPITVTTSYNALGWPTQVQYPAVGDVPGFTVTYSYDALGHRDVVTDTAGSTSYDYDALYQPLAIDAPTGEAQYEYNAAGQRANLVYPSGETVTYTHDAAGRLQTVTDWDGGVTVYTYTAAGRLSGMQLPNSVETSYTYDDAGRLVQIEHSQAGELLARYEYTLDDLGNRIQVEETLKEPTEGTASLPGGGSGLALDSSDEDSSDGADLPLAGSATRMPGLSALLPLWEEPGPGQQEDGSTTITLRAVPTRIPADGVSEATIWAKVSDEEGQPALDGTTLTASTTLGRLAEEKAATRDGVARFTLIAGQETGTAIVTVRAGDVARRVAVELVEPDALGTRVSEIPDVSPFDPDEAAEAARHPVSVDQRGTARAEGEGYTAHFDGDRLTFNLEGSEEVEREGIGLGFTLMNVRVGERVLFERGYGEAEVRAEENRAFVERVSGLDEEYAALDTRVKQSFVLHRSPMLTRGDLVIEGQFHTSLELLYLSDEEGILFLDATGRELLAYTGALVRDALGREIFAQLELEGERVRITVPGAWLTGAEYPVVVDPLIGDVMLVSVGPNYSGSPEVDYNPDDDEWLVVWKDNRNGGDFDVYGQRVQSDGTLAGDNFAIVTAGGSQKHSDVAYSTAAGQYLVVWEDYRNANWDVYGRRVTAGGVVTGSEITVAVASGSQMLPAVAYQPAVEEWLVVWNGGQAQGQRLSSGGELVGSGFDISQDTIRDRPDVAANLEDEEYLVVWYRKESVDEYRVRARRVLSDGTLLGSELVLSPADNLAGYPRVAYNAEDGEYLVVWKDYRNGNWDIYGQRVSADGVLTGGNFAISSLAGDETYPSITWDGRSGRYLVGWQGWGLGQRVWADGALDGGPIYPSASIGAPDHAYGQVSGIVLGVGELYGNVLAQRYAIPVADFSAAPLVGTVPLTVTFDNLSTPLYGATGYTWTFGDGATSTLTEPLHVYTQTGVYTVALTVEVVTETHTLTRTNYVTVSSGGGYTTTTRVITYTYDPLNRLTGADYSTGEQFEYQYDAVGNRTALTATAGTTTYTYDVANRLTSVDGVTYTWDDRGNLVSDGTFTYAYNAAGRLARAESVTSTLVYTYNAQGLRVAQSVESSESVFSWDWAAALPEMLSDGDSLYLVGHETLGQWDGAWTYYLPDALGSVRQAVGGAGAVVSALEWTPYGVEVGAAQAGLGYTGEWGDPNVGMVYLRARWLDPSTGRFPTRDPWPGVQQHPMSFQPYAYASDDPVRYVDPLGLYSCLTDEQWAPELIPLCLLLDSSPEARYLFYQYVFVTGMNAIGWNDAAIFLDHYLEGTGETMYFGSRLVRLIERDTAPLIESSRTQYLSYAARQMGGRAGLLPPHNPEEYRSFLSNATGIPASYAPNPYPISQEVYIALGGVWFDRLYGGMVKEESQGTYRISLLTGFAIDKYWSFRPNTEMYPGMPPGETPESPPAEFNVADRIGIPSWLPRPLLIPPILPFPIIMPIISNPWSVYIPDEWGQALEDDGYAMSFEAEGHWARYEEFLAIDHNCNGWDVGDIVGGSKIIGDWLPTSVDPSLSKSYEWVYR